MALNISGDGTLTGVSSIRPVGGGCFGGAVSSAVVAGTTYRVHRFTSSSTFTVPADAGSVTVEYLIVGGGGGSTGGVNGVNYGAGGGGGTVRSGEMVLAPGVYSVTVGAGGASGASGSASVFNGVTAAGGTSPGTGRTGGSNADFSGFGGTTGTNSGGGAGAGGDAVSGGGGPGVSSTITGTTVSYGGGGGGNGQPGGSGGGGAGAITVGVNGTNGLGGGGGGSGSTNTTSGGSGVVVLRYVTSTSAGIPGLTLVASQAFSAVSSVSVDNCFTADYDDYLVWIRATGGGALTDLEMRLRVGGADDSTASSYIGAGQQLSGTNNSTAVTTDRWRIGYVVSTIAATAQLNLSSPAIAEATRSLTHANRSTDWTVIQSHTHTVASAFDGFTVYPASGTITGRLAVYGYTKGA